MISQVQAVSALLPGFPIPLLNAVSTARASRVKPILQLNLIRGKYFFASAPECMPRHSAGGTYVRLQKHTQKQRGCMPKPHPLKLILRKLCCLHADADSSVIILKVKY